MLGGWVFLELVTLVTASTVGGIGYHKSTSTLDDPSCYLDRPQVEKIHKYEKVHFQSILDENTWKSAKTKNRNLMRAPILALTQAFYVTMNHFYRTSITQYWSHDIK